MGFLLQFYKYQGTGNDFILIDNRNKTITLNQKQIEFLCNRNFGIGADGLMLLETSKTTSFSMRYYNSDGYEGSMCGNGGRCIVSFAASLGICTNDVTFEAVDGLHIAKINKNIISLKMQDVTGVEQIDDDFFLNTGSPHYVRFVENLEELDVFNEGRKIRYNPRFKKGTNVNFIQETEDKLFIRTYERGVENETRSCGTGTVASAIVFVLKNKQLNLPEMNFNTKGGILTVNYETSDFYSFKNIWLKGAADFVFEGIIKL